MFDPPLNPELHPSWDFVSYVAMSSCSDCLILTCVHPLKPNSHPDTKGYLVRLDEMRRDVTKWRYLTPPGMGTGWPHCKGSIGPECMSVVEWKDAGLWM